MNTKLLMQASSIFMGVLGVGAIFMPQEILAYGAAQSGVAGLAVIQITGALYFGFAMLNWTAQANLIGGIYGRPVAIGNLTHFLVAALAILKIALAGGHSILIIAGACIYTVFAILFALVVFRHPVVGAAKH